MGALILVEHYEGVASEAALEMAALARKLGLSVTALICAGSEESALRIAAQIDADTVLGVASSMLINYAPSTYLKCLTTAIEATSPDLVLLSYSTAGIDLAPHSAIATGRQMVGYVTELVAEDGGFTATSLVYGGKLLAKSSLPAPGLAVIMPGAIKADGATPGCHSVEMLHVDFDGLRGVRAIESLTPETEGVDLSKAERILCVGRAVGGTDNLAEAEAVARHLGAEIAGSRPVIDAGWLPKARQVGKSGMKVKPKLYLMAGVSGAPEHLEGMQESELIIALNSDESAPIFAKAHYGAVCDMFEVLPALAERLN